MKKIISYFTIFNILFLNLSFFTLKTAKANSPIYESDNYFVVTAYYSPLPDQNYYFKGSYEADVKLNGRGVRGASGKEVFAGMFAAPKNYAFGTKIYLEGVGIGEVADRGGAIVSTDPNESRGYQYDRIDIWMGFGEEGLARALAWGKRTVKGTVLADSETAVSVNLYDFPAPENVLKDLAKKQDLEKQIAKEIEINPKLSIFEKYIGPESNEENIKMLQEIFLEMGLYNGVIDGKYGSVKESLINYQLKTGVIKNTSNDGAGYFGPITRNQAKKDYLVYIEKNKAEIEAKKKIEAQLASIKKTVENRVNSHINSIGTPKAGDIGENVRILQKTLKTLGYFKLKDSAIFGYQTKTALIKYQIDMGVISSKDDDGAGVFGPKTKEALKNQLVTILENQILKERKLLSYKK